MKNLLLVCWISILTAFEPSLLIGQITLSLQNQYTLEHDAFFVDKLGSMYIVKGSVLTKLDEMGKEVAQFSDQFHTAITWVDVQDPYDILVYYATDNRVFSLDNRLNAKADACYLERIEVDAPTVIAQSHNYNFWVFDPYYLSVLGLDERFEVSTQTKDVSHYTEANYKPNLLLDTGDYLLLNIPSSGVLVFDEQGAYIEKLVYTKLGAYDISASGSLIYLKIMRSLFEINLTDNTRRVVNLPVNARQVVVVAGRYYLSDGAHVLVYDLE